MDNFLSFVVEEWLLFAVAALLLGLIMRSFFIARLTGVAVVNPNEAIRVINDDALVLDVRLEKEFKTGHIKHSVSIPVGALDPRIREIEKHKSGPTLICCQTSSRAMLAAKTLRKHGYDKVSVLSGGLNAWATANLPLEAGNRRDEDKQKEKGKNKKKNKSQNKNKDNKKLSADKTEKNEKSELAIDDAKTDADFEEVKNTDNTTDKVTQDEKPNTSSVDDSAKETSSGTIANEDKTAL